MTHWLTLAAMLALLGVGLGACGDNSQNSPGDTSPDPDPQPSPSSGETSFASAAGSSGQPSPGGAAGRGGADAGAAAPSGDSAERNGGQNSGAERSIEEGDIYQVVRNSDRILNLNRYRGLQIVDFSDPSQPEIIGRTRISGDPVEMYQVGDQVYVLLNNWRGYYGSQSLLPNRYQGGAVVAIDISDPKQPTIESRGQVPGRIETSRLTRGDGEEALFVAATGRDRSQNSSSGGPSSGAGVARVNRAGNTAYVKSFDVSGQGELQEAAELKLDGRVQDIQGADNHLLVARARDNNKSTVSVVDISDPSGQMQEGGQVDVKGRVENKHNLDLHRDVLRVVSGADRNASDTNHVETFDAADIDNLTRIDHETFGDGQNLYATLFMEERAFFVTYRRQDPFHAFEVTTQGQLTEKSEFVVSGWNDYFVPVNDDRRLIGIGKNDEQGETVAVSLYDITDLTNPQPLIDREEVSADRSDSEANRDDRAFTVLEDATSVQADDGTVETGVVLVPFQGYDKSKDKHVSGVEIFTFSDTTVTRRGTMEHGTPVRRSFVADHREKTTANLSEAELSLYDTSDPKDPTELGRVELAPNYERLWTFGQYNVRRNVRRSYYHWYRRSQQTRTDRLEVVPLSKDPDTADAVAKVSVPADASLYRAGSYLVSMEVLKVNRQTNGGQTKATYRTEIRIWDFSDPSSPKLVNTMTTDKLSRNIRGPRAGGPGVGHPEPGGRASRPGLDYYQTDFDIKTVGDALVFTNEIHERESRGTRKYRLTRVKASEMRYRKCQSASPRRSGSGGNTMNACTYYTGGIACSWIKKNDGSTTARRCRGELRKCTRNRNGERSCQKVEPSSAPTRTETRSTEAWDRWTHYEFYALDLSSPASAQITGPVTMPDKERAVSTLAQGDSLYVTHRERYDKPNDPRPYMKYYFKRIDLADPANPQTGNAINIPGELLAVDGSTIVTRNYLWGQQVVEPSVHKLEVQNGLARLKATHRLSEREIEALALDSQGQVLVSHRAIRQYRAGPARAGGQPGRADVARSGMSEDKTQLSVLDLSASLDELSTVDIAEWASLQSAIKQRALFSVPGGMLVVDLRSPQAAEAQAYFPTRGWPRDIVTRDTSLYMPAGRYGIYQFDVTANNLL